MTSKPVPTLAAVFIDFENIYYFLKNHFQDPTDINDYILDMVRNLRVKLEAKSLDCLISYAYADFERLATAPQGALYLMGVNTRNVLGTSHKNAADMQLCIDALEVMYTRPEIKSFILVAGDRDYIPVLQHLRRQGRQVLVSGFRESVSGDLLQNIGHDKFIEARDLLTPERIGTLEAGRNAKLNERIAVAPAATAGVAHMGARTNGATTVVPARTRPRQADEVIVQAGRIKDEDDKKILAHILSETQRFSERRELWLTPYMRTLGDYMPNLTDFDRRDAVQRLKALGAIKMEKRAGEPHDFTVIVVNYNHPDVQLLHPGEN